MVTRIFGKYYDSPASRFSRMRALHSVQLTRSAAPMQPPKFADSLPTAQSPCVRNCCLDEREVCLGCGRHLTEILRWHQTDEAGRLLILEQAAHRLAQA